MLLCCKRTGYKIFHLPFACCRRSLWDNQYLTIVDSGDSPCMVTLKPVALLTQATAELVQNGQCLHAECEGSFTPSRTASNNLGAPENTHTGFNFSGAPCARVGVAPWLSKATHPRKFGNHVTVHRPPTDRPSAPQDNQCLLSHF